MRLYLVNGEDLSRDRKRVSWLVLAQNALNLNLLLPDDFDAEEIIHVADGFTGRDRRLGYAEGWAQPGTEKGLHGMPYAGPGSPAQPSQVNTGV